MKSLLLCLCQLVFLFLCNEAGYWLVETLNVPIPGNVVGMLILFILLMTNIIKLQWIEEATSFLIKHLAFFFIPIAVGLMAYGELFLQNGVAFILALVGSLLIGVLVIGKSAQYLMNKEGEQDA